MALSEVLRLVVEADTQGAVSGIQAVGKSAERELGRSQKSLDLWGNRLTSVGAGLIGFGSIAAAGLGQAALSASDLAETVSKSSTIFGPAADGVEKFAESAADIGLSKQAALDAAAGFGNLFTQVGLSADSAAGMSEEMVRLASDFASFHNADISEVIEAQTAAFRGEYDAVQRFVPTINAAAVEQRALADTGKESADALTAGEKAAATYALMIDGAGAAAGDFARTSDSAANKQRKMAAEFENLKASIGGGALPVLEAVVDVARGGIGVFTDLNSATEGMVGQVATIGTVAALGVGGLSLLAGQAIKMRKTLSDAASGVSSLVSGLKGLSGGQLAIAGIATGLVAVGAALEQYNQAEQRANTKRLTTEFLAAGESAEAMDAVMSSAAKHGPTELIGVFSELASTNRVAAERFIEQAEAAGASDEVLGEMREHLETTGAAEQQMASDTESATGAMDEQVESTQEATSALQEYQDTLRAMTDPVFAAMDAMTGIRDSQVAYQDAIIGVQEAQAALDQAIAEHGSTSAEATAAQRELEGAQRAVTDAQWGQVESAAQADAALAGLLDAVERGDVSVGEFRATLQRWVDQGFLPAGEAADIASYSVGGLINKADDANTKRVNIPVSETGAGETRNRIHSVRDAAMSVPGGKTVSVFTSGTDDARGRLAGVKDAANSIPSSKTIWVEAKLRDLTFGWLGSSGKRATGGPVGAGRLYEVAEQGRAELLEMGGRTYLIPGSDGHVVPASAWGGAAGGSTAGGHTTVIKIDQVVANDPQTLVAQLARYVRTNGPVPIRVSG